MPLDPPVGSIIAFAGLAHNIPPNYRLCDGTAVSRQDPAYVDLFNAIGTSWGWDGNLNFNLPDLRGLFLRGVNQGSGRDPDAAVRTTMNAGGHSGDQVGSFQPDQLRNHTHSYAHGNQFADGGQDFAAMKDDGRLAATTGSGGSETRPINANVLWIIRIS